MFFGRNQPAPPSLQDSRPDSVIVARWWGRDRLRCAAAGGQLGQCRGSGKVANSLPGWHLTVCRFMTWDADASLPPWRTRVANSLPTVPDTATWLWIWRGPPEGKGATQRLLSPFP